MIFHACASILFYLSITDGLSNPSGSSVAEGDLLSIDNHRDPPRAAGELQHLLQPGRIFLDIDINCLAFVSRPGLVGIGSTRLAVNDDLFRHGVVPP
jgi:hypothetical protein